MKKKSIIFSGIQPTGKLNIGHYISILSYLNKNINKFKYFICIADLHALTNNNYNYNNIKKNILDILAIFISLNIKFKDNMIFLQSSISEHLKLFWILSTIIDFKKIIKIHKYRNILNKYNNMGNINYPILMASDILLYNTKNILVGIDQKKNIEFTKYILKKINNIYGKVFTKIEKCLINNNYNIMSLLNPNKKMSKSDKINNNIIFILDDKKTINFKINKSITDSDNNLIKIKFDIKNKPGISNLINILSNLKNISINNVEKKFKYENYKTFKKYISDTIYNEFKNIRNNFFYIRKNEYLLNKILNNNNKIIKKIAKNSFNKIKEKIYKL